MQAPAFGACLFLDLLRSRSMAKAGSWQAKARKSRAKGRTSAEQFVTAQRRIQEARESGATELDLSDLRRLAALPPELADLAALQDLNLDDTLVSDLTPLADLTALQNLTFRHTRVRDVSCLAGLTTLQGLFLMDTQVIDMRPLARLMALQNLSLMRTPVRDLAPLADLVALRTFYLNGTKVRDLAPLRRLTALQRLHLMDTPISDLAPLADLTALQHLDLDSTRVSDLAPLAGLTSLQGLDLRRTAVSDLAPLAGLAALQDGPVRASKNALRHVGAEGLSYAKTPIAAQPPFDQLSRLEQPARTVETINAVRRQQGLPPHKPEGYERPANLDKLWENVVRDVPPLGEHLLEPPSDPLPGPSPATRFTVVGGRVDIVASTAWKDRKEQAAIYHSRASKLANVLADRLLRTDAVPDVAASVAALTDVLGDNVERVQPDQLRMASRSIAAKARAYGHPGAQWEISAESVSAIFELADLLVDLQGFAKADLEQNERAIRDLDLTATSAAEAKEILDEITAAIEGSPEVITINTEDTFVAAAEVSAVATPDVAVSVEGERILLTENLALAIARELGREKSEDAAAARVARGDEEETEPKPRRSKARRATRTKMAPPGQADVWTRVANRLKQKGPEKAADAMLEAMSSTIKHSPKSLAALAAFIYTAAQTSPYLLSYGPIALTLAWIGYEIMKRAKPQR